MSSKTALLVMDVLEGMIPRITLPKTYLHLLSQTITKARSSSIKIIYVTIAFRPHHPEISTSNLAFSAAAKGNAFLIGTPEVQVHASIAPQEDDIVVVKKRVSAFTGSDLEIILRSLEIKTLVLCGMSTGGVVLSTLCEAADKDYGLVVLKDICVDPNEEVHHLLMNHIFPKRGKVIDAEEWLAGLEGEASDCPTVG